ncbi:MAG: EAL domain-containing protein [Gammaproteobacteria bacterium]|nr:EAL domain-containing protein [Gammaproteobacteria bacterium]
MAEQTRLVSQITRLALGAIILTALAMVTLFAFYTYHQLQDRAESNLFTAEKVVKDYLSAKNQLLTTAATVLAADFGFKQAVATNDSETIESVLQNHGARINADLMLLINQNGEFSFSSNTDAINKQQLASALSNTNFNQSFLSLDGKLFKIIAVPVKAPHTIGYAVIGFLIDKTATKELKDLSQVEIEFYDQNNILLVSSLDKAMTDSDFLSRIANLESDSNLKAHLLFDLTPLKWEFYRLIGSVSLVAIFIVVLSLFASRRLALSISKPLNRFIKASKRIADGSFSEDLSNDSKSLEIDDLTIAFNLMSKKVKDREQQIVYQANHDSLTNLANRHLFTEQLNHLIRQEELFIVIAMNVRNFKRVNDVLGMQTGDRCLKSIADRLAEHFHDNIYLSSRLSADTFIIAQPLIDDAQELLKELNQRLIKPLSFDNLSLQLNFIYSYCLIPQQGQDADTIIRRVLLSLERARTEKQVFRAYVTGEDEEHLLRLTLIDELRDALESNSSALSIVFHPKVSLNNLKPTKAEVLMRWEHPKHGFISPELFIALAEQSGLIVNLTRWVLKQSFNSLITIHKLHPDLKIAINIAAQDLAQAGFIENVVELCSEYDISSKHIIFELTERDIIENQSLIIKKLDALRAIGFEISVDDFGIGQSSLSLLRTLPVDELKIDKSFILDLDTNLDNQYIVQSTIELGHKLGLRIIAEGVENEASLQHLIFMKCDYAQGYYFAKPLAINKFLDWFKHYDQTLSV